MPRSSWSPPRLTEEDPALQLWHGGEGRRRHARVYSHLPWGSTEVGWASAAIFLSCDILVHYVCYVIGYEKKRAVNIWVKDTRRMTSFWTLKMTHKSVSKSEWHALEEYAVNDPGIDIFNCLYGGSIPWSLIFLSVYHMYSKQLKLSYTSWFHFQANPTSEWNCIATYS